MMPRYYLLANYPCYRLWPEMAKYLKEKLGNKLNDSVYKGWINENGDFSSATKLSAMIESYREEFTKDPQTKAKAQKVFLDAMRHEVAFFNSVAEAF